MDYATNNASFVKRIMIAGVASLSSSPKYNNQTDKIITSQVDKIRDMIHSKKYNTNCKKNENQRSSPMNLISADSMKLISGFFPLSQVASSLMPVNRFCYASLSKGYTTNAIHDFNFTSKYCDGLGLKQEPNIRSQTILSKIRTIKQFNVDFDSLDEIVPIMPEQDDNNDYNDDGVDDDDDDDDIDIDAKHDNENDLKLKIAKGIQNVWPSAFEKPPTLEISCC